MTYENELSPAKYVRKPFYIDGVQVTADNMAAVAAWCGGILQSKDTRSGPVPYVSVAVTHPVNERQTMAYVGDWVLKANTTFKVYTAKAFEQNFEPSTDGVRCNNTTMTADGGPCVFDKLHRGGENPTGCRSFADYKYLRPVPFHTLCDDPDYDTIANEDQTVLPIDPDGMIVVQTIT
jgi:hypothetical protein